MSKVIVLFNLKPGVSREDYERWARESDLPTVNALGSVRRFEVLRASGLLLGEGEPPYQYIEIIDVADLAAFGQDVSRPEVQRGAEQFQGFAQAPVFILSETL